MDPVDTAFLDKWNVDCVAHDEEPYVSEGHGDVYALANRKRVRHHVCEKMSNPTHSDDRRPFGLRTIV